MSIETLINTTTLPSMTIGAENTVQTPGGISEAFTTTLQAQVQRLNVTPTITTTPIISASVNANVTIPTVEINISAPPTTLDSASVTLQVQATAKADSNVTFPNLLNNALSTPVGSQNEPLVVKNSGDTKPVSTTLPAVDALTPSALDVKIPVSDTLPVDRQISATTSAAAATRAVVLPQVVDRQLASSTTAEPVQKLNVTQMTMPSSALAIKKDAPADTIQGQLTALLNSNVAEAGTQQTDRGQVVLNPSVSAKKMDRMRAAAEEMAVGQISVAALNVVPTTEMNVNLKELASPLEAVLTPTPEAAVNTTTQEAAVNSLLQAGVLQPVMVNILKTPTPKTESLLTALPKNSSAVTSLPNAAAAGVTDAATPSNVVSDLAAVSDITAPQMTFTAVLDHLKPNDSSAALDAGLAKTLSHLSAELAMFDRPVHNPVKAEIAPMTAHLYSPHFNEELGTKIVWMTTQNMSSAELTLNPKHLGPIAIQINMQQDQASVAFTAQNAGVKEMLEASIPKLRDMLQTQNLNLADVNVSQQSFSGQNQGQAPHNEGQKHASAGVDHSVDVSTPVNETAEHIEQSRTLVSNGLVSLYA